MTNPPDDFAPNTATPTPAAPSKPPPREPRQPDLQMITYIEKSQDRRDASRGAARGR